MFKKEELVRTDEYWQEVIENNLWALKKGRIKKKKFIADMKRDILEALELVSPKLNK